MKKYATFGNRGTSLSWTTPSAVIARRETGMYGAGEASSAAARIRRFVDGPSVLGARGVAVDVDLPSVKQLPVSVPQLSAERSP